MPNAGIVAIEKVTAIAQLKSTNTLGGDGL